MQLFSVLVAFPIAVVGECLAWSAQMSFQITQMNFRITQFTFRDHSAELSDHSAQLSGVLSSNVSNVHV